MIFLLQGAFEDNIAEVEGFPSTLLDLDAGDTQRPDSLNKLALQAAGNETMFSETFSNVQQSENTAEASPKVFWNLQVNVFLKL